MNYRNRKLLDLARGSPCMAQIEGFCNGDTATVVAAHGNHIRMGKGKGIKSHDIFAIPMCAACHYETDAGKELSSGEKEWYWVRGFERWMLYMWEHELVTVKGSTGPREPVFKRSSKILPRRAA